MLQLFERVSSYWVRYDKYEIRTDVKGTKYVTAAADAFDADEKKLMAQGVAAFGGIAPTYRIALQDKSTIVWDFHSLLIGLQMMFSFMMAKDKTPLRMSDSCDTIFAANRKTQRYCCAKCRRKDE